MDNVIEVHNLVKKYNGFTAVAGINFQVRRGECFGILGPNGAGKSSTVKMIYCFSPVTAGEITVLGMDVLSRPREIKARMGVVAQENNLDPDLTALQNLVSYAGFYRISSAEARERALELLGVFGLEEWSNHKVDDLSGGMKRKLTIARGLINRPEVLILDEPTTGLDPQARHVVWQQLNSLRERGVTLLLTTHYLDEAQHLCDRLIIMHRGTIVEEGAPGKLVERHIGAEVVEVVKGAGAATEIVASSKDFIKGHLVVGDNLYLYPLDGRELVRLLGQLGVGRLYLRPATLEDVFLKLTGRGLVEE
ncbi:ABC transporter ATP-binding protein [Desulfotruncus alcoholivorax]|uniref:ABC transporter ATP-binding protein n=1 Tax=Desulfotruncus alcoholivorax TaxID=265477 RepID=UPI00040A9263|nr:ABC transporter ATP-binding protein [Desulfotruncus alcoholivorax]